MWNILLSVTITVAIAVTVAEAWTPLFSLLVSKMTISVNFSLF
jgi:hypothetical protein